MAAYFKLGFFGGISSICTFVPEPNYQQATCLLTACSLHGSMDGIEKTLFDALKNVCRLCDQHAMVLVNGQHVFRSWGLGKVQKVMVNVVNMSIRETMLLCRWSLSMLFLRVMVPDPCRLRCSFL